MSDIPLLPVIGMNTVSEDAVLHRRSKDESSLQVRDAVNVDITKAGKLDTRKSIKLASGERYQNLWQSPLHGDVFATLEGEWGLLDMSQEPWAFRQLANIGRGRVRHVVLNNLVAVCGTEGIFTYNGEAASRLTISTPPPPLVIEQDEGSLAPGTYGFAISWFVDGKESGVSAIAHKEVQGGGVRLVIPSSPDQSVNWFAIYMTKQNGGELQRQGAYPVSVVSVDVTSANNLGHAAKFRHLSPMPTGDHFAYWRGRLLTASANVLRFSEPLAYHLHDERHGFIQMPQRITFVVPVDGGIWIGQVDHVAFLEGDTPSVMRINHKTANAPVPFSAILATAEDLGGDLSQGGAASAVWLAGNGYVVGTAGGQIVELHANKLSGIGGSAGATVRLDGRFTTAIT